VKFFDVTPVGRIVNRFTSDMASIDQSVIYQVRQKDAVSAQKLGQLQRSIAAPPQECTGQLASFGPT
jgi:hypothetical protein